MKGSKGEQDEERRYNDFLKKLIRVVSYLTICDNVCRSEWYFQVDHIPHQQPNSPLKIKIKKKRIFYNQDFDIIDESCGCEMEEPEWSWCQKKKS